MVDEYVPTQDMVFVNPHWSADLMPNRLEDIYVKIEDYQRLEAELARIKELYDEWGYKDAPCPKHSKEPLLIEYCASCRAEKSKAELAECNKKYHECFNDMTGLIEAEREDNMALRARCERLEGALKEIDKMEENTPAAVHWHDVYIKCQEIAKAAITEIEGK